MEFDFPKSPDLIRQLLRIGSKDDDVILDFFGGSGTTAEAVLRQNLADNSQRSYLLVQLPEPLDAGNSRRSLASLMIERVRAASGALSKTHPTLDSASLDSGFRCFALRKSNFTVWDAARTTHEGVAQQLEISVEHVIAGATERSMLVELLLKSGFPLTAPVESRNFAGVKGFAVADDALVVCLSDALTIGAVEAMVELDPSMILLLDKGFGGSDELKVNALQTVRARNQRVGSDIALKVV